MDGIETGFRLSILLVFVAFMSACGSDGASEETATPDTGWPIPQCDKPSGTWAVGFSTDGGETISFADEERPESNAYTAGLLLLESPGWILAATTINETAHIQLSKDSGCTWEEIGAVEGMSMTVLEPRTGNTAYAWSWYTDDLLYIDAEKATPDAVERRSFSFESDSLQVQGFASSLDDPDRVAYFNDGGWIQYSPDGGLTWAREDRRPVPDLGSNPSGIFYHAEFDRSDLDHVVIGTVTEGLQYSLDAGETWDIATISSASSGDIFCYDVRYTPGNPNVMWALCKDIDESDGGAPNQGRHIYRSGDGGLSFQMVLESSNSSRLTNSSLLATQADRPEEIFFEFFSCFNVSPDGNEQGGTDIYHYDNEVGEVTEYWHSDLDGVHTIRTAPGRPDLVYFGLDSEPRC